MKYCTVCRRFLNGCEKRCTKINIIEVGQRMKKVVDNTILLDPDMQNVIDVMYDIGGGIFCHSAIEYWNEKVCKIAPMRECKEANVIFKENG